MAIWMPDILTNRMVICMVATMLKLFSDSISDMVSSCKNMCVELLMRWCSSNLKVAFWSVAKNPF